MRARSKRVWMAAGAAMLLAWPRHASAQVAVGVDAGATYEPRVGWGLGFDGRLGYRFGLPREAILHSLIMHVEAIAGQMFLAPWANPVAVERFGGGLRLGWLLDEVEPFAFAHISAAADPNGWGYLGDVGGALDWRLRTFSLGLHATHSWLSLVDGNRQVWEFGPHVEVRGASP
jgi:hypothetical protein